MWKLPYFFAPRMTRPMTHENSKGDGGAVTKRIEDVDRGGHALQTLQFSQKEHLHIWHLL